MNERAPRTTSDQTGRPDPEGTAAFCEVFNRYYTRLCYFSYQIIGDKTKAEDICQEVFLRFWNQRNQLDGGEKAIKNYLYTAVRNLSISFLRHHKVEARYLEQYEAPVAEEAHIAHALIRAEVVSEVHRALETLPPGCRQVVQMAYFEGLKNAEIASKLGVSLNTVKTQRQRAIRLLRSKVRPEILLLLLLC